MITDFPFKEIDAEGLETLLAISKADRFNRWMYETIKPFVTGNILEIGSGIGNISNYFLDDHQQITISDIRENYLDFSRNEFQSYSNLKGIVNIDLMDENFDK